MIRVENHIKAVLRASFVICSLAVLSACKEEPASPAAPESDAAVPAESPAAAPDVLPSILKVKRQAKTYVITGIGMKGSNKVAIINNKVVKPGEEIDDGVFVKEVQPTYAIIVVGNKEHLLRPEDIQRELDRKTK